jgi:hypothetical protein
MEPEGSLPCPQQPATDDHPEPDESGPHLPTLFPEEGIFLLTTVSRPALGSVQPPIQWVPGILSPGG